MLLFLFFFSSRRRHTRCGRDWSSDVCSSDLLDKIEKEEAERLERFNERIAAADAMFDQENFIDAKKEYEKALQIDPNSVYANDRIQLSVVKAKEKTQRGDNVRYQKILTKADEYFDDENYDK